VVDEKTIRFGLYSIKNFGTGVADSIIKARADGPFADLADFLSRVTDKNLNKKSLESLIMCGALDDLPAQAGSDGLCERGALLANIETLLAFHKEHIKAPVDQGSLFGGMEVAKAKLVLQEAESATQEEKLGWEKDLLGLYVSGHPLDKHKEKIARQKMDIATHKEKFPKGLETVIAGYVDSIQTIMTKGGERMLFAKLSDYSGGVELVAFPRVAKEDGKLLTAGACVMVKGKFSERNGETSFVVERARAL
jgi:DNA polymerase-3 subunit alpha